MDIVIVNFEIALRELKNGKKITRSGWNGKDMFLYHVPKNIYDTQTQIAKDEFGSSVAYEEYIAMKTNQGYVIPWVASQTDLLSDDWIILD